MDRLSEAEIDRIFHALADRTRRDILAVTAGDGRSISALAERYPMSFAAVQKHVAVLEEAGLVTKERRGRERLVRTEVDPIRRVSEVLDGIEDLWRSRLERIDELLAEQKSDSEDDRKRLARTTSSGFAKELIFTGRMCSAEEALRQGLVNQVTTAAGLMDRALELADEIAAKPAWSIATAKEVVNLALDGDLRGHLARELDAFALAFTTADQREGMDAFIEKRPARFVGH